MNRHRSPLELMAEVALALVKRPHTQTSLAEVVGTNTRSDQVVRYIDAFREVGLVYIKEWPRLNGPLFAWNPTPFQFQDAPRPMYKGRVEEVVESDHGRTTCTES